jgi:hypothetical protein
MTIVYTEHIEEFKEIMHYIDPSKTRNWQLEQSTKYYVPKSVPSKCPFCNQQSSFETNNYTFSPHLLSIAATGECTLCGEKTKLWVVGVKNEEQVKATNNISMTNKQSEEIWMLPKPVIEKEISLDRNKIPERIFKGYEEAINCFNSGYWRATVTECGRTLEGITQNKFDNEKEIGKLTKTIDDFDKTDTINITEKTKNTLFSPILKLSKAIRLGRNKGAHFDIAEPNKEVAEKVLELTEYAIRYFYVLPIDALELETKINELGDIETTED